MAEFAKVRHWTCPKHDSPWRHECNCQDCDREWDCDFCAKAEWHDVLNEDGTQKMRELGPMEQFFLDDMRRELEASSRFLDLLSKPPVKTQPRINFGDLPGKD